VKTQDRKRDQQESAGHRYEINGQPHHDATSYEYFSRS
jgi:hypothetical protein